MYTLVGAVFAAVGCYAVTRWVYRAGYRSGAHDTWAQIEENDRRLTEHVLDKVGAWGRGPEVN